MLSKVFISWGGDLSKQLAEELSQWIPSVLQFVKPYFTPDDIEKGSHWESCIANELSTSNFGLICLTSDNLTRPWILFEAGTLSKNLGHSHVCPILFNVDPTTLNSPLSCFQTTQFNKSDFRKLIQTINNTCGEYKLSDIVLNKVFEKWWPEFEERINTILSSQPNPPANQNERSEADLLKEILELTRISAKSDSVTSESLRRSLRHLLHSMDNIIMRGDYNSDIRVLDELYPAIEMMCDRLGCTMWFNQHMENRNRIMHRM